MPTRHRPRWSCRGAGHHLPRFVHPQREGGLAGEHVGAPTSIDPSATTMERPWTMPPSARTKNASRTPSSRWGVEVAVECAARRRPTTSANVGLRGCLRQRRSKELATNGKKGQRVSVFDRWREQKHPPSVAQIQSALRTPLENES